MADRCLSRADLWEGCSVLFLPAGKGRGSLGSRLEGAVVIGERGNSGVGEYIGNWSNICVEYDMNKKWLSLRLHFTGDKCC